MLIGALGLDHARLISLSGAGGKTSLMFSLAREFVAAGERVLITTTTKMAYGETLAWPSFAASSVAQVLKEACRLLPETGPGRSGAVIAYTAVTGDGSKITGFAPGLVDQLARIGHFDRILVEADGSARKPLKAPAAHEPVIPATTHALIAVAGINGLGRPLGDDNVFRANIWSSLSGLASGGPVTAESLARTAAHPDGLARGGPPNGRTILFLNQADTPERQNEAKRVLQCLASIGKHPIQRGVIGWLLPQPKVIETLSFSRDIPQ